MQKKLHKDECKITSKVDDFFQKSGRGGWGRGSIKLIILSSNRRSILPPKPIWTPPNNNLDVAQPLNDNNHYDVQPPNND